MDVCLRAKFEVSSILTSFRQGSNWTPKKPTQIRVNLANIYLFKVNDRNNRKKVWNMFKFNNEHS